MNNLIRILQILSNHTQDKYCFGAEHDVIYFYIDPNVVPTGEVQLLEELGCYASFEDEHFYIFP